MRNYKYATWVTLLLWIFSLIFYIIAYCVDNEFWKNIFIALFGSAILSFITSVIAYRQQRKNTLEKFYNRTNEILHIWSKYFYLNTKKMLLCVTSFFISFYYQLLPLPTNQYNHFHSKRNAANSRNRHPQSTHRIYTSHKYVRYPRL